MAYFQYNLFMMNRIRLIRLLDWVTVPYTIYLFLRDSNVSWRVKLRSVLLLVLISGYVFIPIDLIPDFIPFSGWLDDLVIAPLGLMLVSKVIPEDSIGESKKKAGANIRRVLLWSIFSLSIAVTAGVLLTASIIYLITRLAGS